MRLVKRFISKILCVSFTSTRVIIITYIDNQIYIFEYVSLFISLKNIKYLKKKSLVKRYLIFRCNSHVFMSFFWSFIILFQI